MVSVFFLSMKKKNCTINIFLFLITVPQITTPAKRISQLKLVFCWMFLYKQRGNHKAAKKTFQDFSRLSIPDEITELASENRIYCQIWNMTEGWTGLQDIFLFDGHYIRLSNNSGINYSQVLVEIVAAVQVWPWPIVVQEPPQLHRLSERRYKENAWRSHLPRAPCYPIGHRHGTHFMRCYTRHENTKKFNMLDF